MSIFSRPNRRRLRSLWTGSKRPPSTTDDIPPRVDPTSNSLESRPQLIRHASDPTLQDASLRPAILNPPIAPVNASMQGEATVTFTQPGVQPPVYVVTSLSTPPWAPIELKPAEEKTTSGDLVFEQKFANVAEGSYQYKIRIGEGHWVVDESKESATDEHGNRNNVVHVKPSTSHALLDRPANTKDVLDRKDSSMDVASPGGVPVPFVVVEKVEDKAQPEYGDVKPKTLAVDDFKRAADPEPDFEETKTDSPLDVKPLLSLEDPDELEPPEMRAPLFRHESFQDSGESLPEPAMDAIEEESAQYSTDHTSSGDGINTPSAESQDDLQDHDELGHGPLLSHETGLANKKSRYEEAPLFSHETGPGADESDEDEFEQGPLLPHETGFTSQKKHTDDYDEDEFDAGPLLPHETGFSSYKSSETSSKKGGLNKFDYYEPEHYTRYGNHSDDGRGSLDLAPTFSHEQELLTEDYGAPLLPHERGSAAESFSGSERSFSMSPITYEAPTFGQETDKFKDSYGGSMRPPFFRTRTSSSTLPNKLPQSDAEDTDLHEPGLEIFPVGREQILERVATIGNKLPEDETHGAPVSPQPSVLSQACSSVDLKPVKSYISLASVREDEEEDDEEDNADVESVGSPMIMSHSGSRFARYKDPLATPHPDDSKQLDFVSEDKLKTQGMHNPEPSEANSVGKTDGTKDRGMKDLSDIIASRATVMNTLTPPLTPSTLEALDKENLTSASESELRQRRGAAEETVESSTLTPRPEVSNDEKDSSADLVASAVEKLTLEDSPQSWRGASIGVSTLVAVGAVCYYLAMLRLYCTNWRIEKAYNVNNETRSPGRYSSALAHASDLQPHNSDLGTVRQQSDNTSSDSGVLNTSESFGSRLPV
ncbi:hypothetical protein OPT61_g8580 [Boeremia exigua]|uniref:Uncharacterized protein n=1 Tax=Boeremia exigua TaxID=749465 RepID=A0ACC2HYS5_9PLEO|nr:hypothetical protein OPT61_g8580 [Boeremia exigua]